MIYLASVATDRPSPKQMIADAEGISPDYVEQILMRLKAAGLVISIRGVKGGFQLARSPETITIADVISATEGPLDLAPCFEQECDRESVCITREVWAEASDALRKVFEARTLSEMAERIQHKQMTGVISYSI
jgi:Rrf2 family iron-sulfur cluster assembly transcriptional regulator